jgi:hypothetical protein
LGFPINLWLCPTPPPRVEPSKFAVSDDYFVPHSALAIPSTPRRNYPQPCATHHSWLQVSTADF